MVGEEFRNEFRIMVAGALCVQTGVPVMVWIDEVIWCGVETMGRELCVIRVHNSSDEVGYAWHVGDKEAIEEFYRLSTAAQARWKPNLWTPRAVGHVDLWVLDDEEFEQVAKGYGWAPTIGAFALWGSAAQAIFTRTSTTHLIGHELRHIDERQDYHAGPSGAAGRPID